MTRAGIRLSRVVRFVVNPAGVDAPAGTNGYGGKPAMRGLGRYYELDVVCSGEPSRDTGYLINIKDIDDAARRTAVPIVEQACVMQPEIEPGEILAQMVRSLGAALEPTLESVTFRLSPTYGLTMHTSDPGMVVVRQRFDFAAAHRLHVPSMSDAENRELFGHCNHASGHGHNYQVEPAVEMPAGAPVLGLDAIERLTDGAIVDVFDHTNLDRDHEAFQPDSGGTTSSVENIARVCFERLAPRIAEASGGRARLRGVTVWETERTSATYPG